MHVTHLRSVPLDVESGGSACCITLPDVASVPHCNEAGLISSRNMDMLGCFQMVGEDGMSTV